MGMRSFRRYALPPRHHHFAKDRESALERGRIFVILFSVPQFVSVRVDLGERKLKTRD